MGERGPSDDHIVAKLRRANLSRSMQLNQDIDWSKKLAERESYDTDVAIVAVAIWIGLSGLSLVFFVNWDTNFIYTYITITLCILISALVAGVLGRLVLNSNRTATASDILDDYERVLHARQDKMAANLEKIANEAELYQRGHTYIVGDNAILVIGKVVQSQLIAGDVINSVVNDQNQDAVAKAITTIAAVVNDSGIAKARDAFEDLNEAIEHGQRPTRIEAAWNLLISILPEVAKLAGAAATIVGLFT